jgi:DNA topoisomerase-1
MPKPILVIVESPSKCRKIETFLGPGYKVIASFGHIMKLNSLENINVSNNFECRYDVIEEKSRNIELMRQYINDVPEVILACDNDREGEAICASICRLFQLPVETTKRIIFTEITETAIQYAIRNPTIINMNLVHAQQAREVLDILVGFTVSPILWNGVARKHKTSLSAGRCQTPALRLVYDNYLDIKQSSSVITHKIYGIFTSLNLKFELNKEFNEGEEVVNFLELCKTYQFRYVGMSNTSTQRSSPEPLTTSKLQQLANNVMNLSPKDTMKYAQELYENGYITYMRTDCKKYSEEFVNMITNYITNTYSVRHVRENISDYIKPINSEDPHEAIRPVMNVNKIDETSGIHEKAKKLYELIWVNSIQSCMSYSLYNIITCKINAPQESEFQYKMENNIFLGWEACSRKKDGRTEVDESEMNNDTNNNKNKNKNKNVSYYFENLVIDLVIHYKKIESEFTLIGKKLHLSESKLVNLLEEKGIGRPSTFASLIDKIIFRNYVEKRDIEGTEITNFNYTLNANCANIVETSFTKNVGKEKNKLVMTSLGIIVIEFLLEKMEELFSYEYTQNMECELDVIASGNKTWQTLCQSCHDELTQIIRDTNNVQTFSMAIDDRHTLIMGKYGPVVKVTNRNNKCVDFLKVRDDLDLDELRSKESLKLEDVVSNNINNSSSVEPIGKYRGKDLYVKKGKYGIYAQWGDERKSLKEEFGNPTNVNNINYLDVLRYLEKDTTLDASKPVGFVRELSENISIRNGKWGDYVHYKKPRVKNPVFISLKEFDENHRTCDRQVLLNWLKINHNVKC